jgi:chloride channel protein, CIC family
LNSPTQPPPPDPADNGHTWTLRREVRRWRRLSLWWRTVVFWTGAVLTGLVAVAFAIGSDGAQHLFGQLASVSGTWRWLAPPLGFALAGWLTARYFPEARGSGIPQTIAALHLKPGAARDRLMSLKNAAGKFFLTIFALGCGASAGREGPTVQIGASIMYSLGRFVRLPSAGLNRGLILAGGAAGVAAAFNTPLAGVVFAIEELSRSFEERSAGIIFVTVVLAGVTSVALTGNYTYFGSTSATLEGLHGWIVVPVCGVVGGLAGGLFARAMLGIRFGVPRLMRRFPRISAVHVALACGLLVALLGWWSNGNAFGTGYEQARDMLQHGATSGAWYPLQKILATLASYATGFPAGIFAPSLAAGAGIGGTLSHFFTATPEGTVVVLTMASYFAGVVQAPLTALVIVGEMIGDRSLTLPLMAVVLIGRGASALVCRESLYRTLARQFMGIPER